MGLGENEDIYIFLVEEKKKDQTTTKQLLSPPYDGHGTQTDTFDGQVCLLAQTRGSIYASLHSHQ